MLAALSRYQPLVLSALRIAAALLFLEHGLMKIFQIPLPQPGATYPLPPIFLAAGLIETVGGVLLLFGLFTRAAAFVASGEMAFAYFIGHAPHGPWPAANEGDAAILFCFVFLYVTFAGGGSLTLDQLLFRHDGMIGRRDDPRSPSR